MKNIIRVLLILIITFTIFLFIDCTRSQTDKFSQVLGKEWKVVSIDGKELIAAELENGLPRIIFHETDKFSGTTSCNTFYGTYKLENSKINLDPGSITKMMCDGNTEMEFLNALDEITEWKLNEN
jgi:heat shock protein HslJ